MRALPRSPRRSRTCLRKPWRPCTTGDPRRTRGAVPRCELDHTIARVAHRLPESSLMTRHASRTLALATIVALGACSGASRVFHGVIDDDPPATEAQVAAMLNFDAYIT